MPSFTSTATSSRTTSDSSNGSAKSFQITGADGAKIEIQPGEYYFNSKARCRRMMQNSLSSEARQVHACLELATMGFRRELAMVKEERPIRPIEIADQTGLQKQNVSRALTELEEQGLAMRRSVDGKVEIYSWAVPKPATKEPGNRARLPIPSYIPHSWEPLIALAKRWKLEFTVDEVSALDYEDEGAEASQKLLDALAVARAFFDKVCAPLPLNKEERKERNIRKESSSSFLEEPELTTTNGHGREHNYERDVEETATGNPRLPEHGASGDCLPTLTGAVHRPSAWTAESNRLASAISPGSNGGEQSVCDIRLPGGTGIAGTEPNSVDARYLQLGAAGEDARGQPEDERGGKSQEEIGSIDETACNKEESGLRNLKVNLRNVLAEHGKGTLTPKQFSEVEGTIAGLECPDDAATFLIKEHLPGRLPRIRHPGALPAIAREFAALWPALLKLRSSPPAKPRTAIPTKPEDDVIERFYAKRRKRSGY